MTSFQVLFIGVMSCMYVLWDVIGVYSPPSLWMIHSHASKMIPSAARSTVQTRVHSLTSAVAAHPEVSTPFRLGVPYILINAIVWGVIWLIIAFVFFGLGLIVGIVVFKVLFNSVS
jgi:hypothetical protein